MTSLGEIGRRLRALVRRGRLDQDLEDEIRFHLALREESYRRKGLPPEEARQAAARRFGNATALKEECREQWTFAPLERLGQDLRYTGRLTRRSPGFTAVAVLSLAIGIGGNGAMFSLVSAILLRPLPYPDAGRLVRVTGFYPKGAVVALQAETRTMDVAGVGGDAEFNITGGGEAVRVAGNVVSATLFATLGRGAERGRVFETGDDRPGRDRVVLLSHALWESRFGGDPAIVGRAITVDGYDREVVG